MREPLVAIALTSAAKPAISIAIPIGVINPTFSAQQAAASACNNNICGC